MTRFLRGRRARQTKLDRLPLAQALGVGDAYQVCNEIALHEDTNIALTLVRPAFRGVMERAERVSVSVDDEGSDHDGNEAC